MIQPRERRFGTAVDGFYKERRFPNRRLWFVRRLGSHRSLNYRAMTDVMIECEGLTKRFGTFTAVDHVSFSVAKGSIFGFLGPNGSGKSTLIRVLCGILEPSEGTARIGGRDIVTEGEAIKETMGHLSQKF